MHGSLSESVVSAMYVVRCSGLQIKPSWHKLNHQNCAAACQPKMQSPSCVMCGALYDDFFLSRAVLLLTRPKRSMDVRACMLCKGYHACSSGICHPGSYLYRILDRPLFLHQVSCCFYQYLLFSSKVLYTCRSRREKGLFIGTTTLT